MSQPFAKLHILRTSTQGQEVTPDIQRGVLLLEEVLGGIRVICTEAFHGQTVGQRGRVRQCALGDWSLRGALRGVLVVSSPTKPLATMRGKLVDEEDKESRSEMNMSRIESRAAK